MPEAGAVTLYNCGVGTEIAIIKQQGAWSAILMSDRSTGWLPTRYLKFTGVSVDITSQVETGEQQSDDSVEHATPGFENEEASGNSGLIRKGALVLGGLGVALGGWYLGRRIVR